MIIGAEGLADKRLGLSMEELQERGTATSHPLPEASGILAVGEVVEAGPALEASDAFLVSAQEVDATPRTTGGSDIRETRYVGAFPHQGYQQ